MLYILIFIIGVVIGFYASRRASVGHNRGESFANVNEEERVEIERESRRALAERLEERKERILEFMRREGSYDQALQTCGIEKGENSRGVTRAEVEKFLDVSEKTADKYLDELEAEGKIEQIGATGRGVHYILRPTN